MNAHSSPRSRLRLLVVAEDSRAVVEKLQHLASQVDITVVPRDAEQLGRELRNTDVLFLWDYRSTALRQAWRPGRLRWVHVAAVGVDPLMFPELLESPVILTHTRGVFETPVAEFAVALILHFAKRIGEVLADSQARRWRHLDTRALHGATVGIVGFGEIGRRVARLVRAFGMRVLALRRGVAGPDPDADIVFSGAQLGELLARADYVVLTVPLTPATRGLVGEAELRQMRRDAYLINVSRGSVVDERALARALADGWIAGAALDVFEREPLPPDDPIYDAPNLVISSHMAGDVQGWEDRVLDVFFDNLQRFTAGQPLRFVVDRRRGY